MKKEMNKIKTQIDFGVTRGHLSSSLIYTTLNHYNRGGSTKMTASQLIGVAFEFYDATESPDITLFIDARTRARAFIERYEVNSRSEIKKAAENVTPHLEIELLQPSTKFFCFDGDNKSIQIMWQLLEGMRYRDRASFLNKVLFQYFAHGNCNFYNELCSERLLVWLKEELLISKEIGMERFNRVADMILDYAGSAEPIIENDDLFIESSSTSDRLRKAMGLTEIAN